VDFVCHFGLGHLDLDFVCIVSEVGGRGDFVFQPTVAAQLL